MKAFRFLHHE